MAAATAQGQTHVLIVEDDPSTSEVVQKTLMRHGFTSDCAASVGEALVFLEGPTVPQVIVLDINLPDANGALLLRKIRREGLPVRVAVVTGVANPERYNELLDVPGDRLFPKPVNMAELVRWLRAG